MSSKRPASLTLNKTHAPTLVLSPTTPVIGIDDEKASFGRLATQNQDGVIIVQSDSDVVKLSQFPWSLTPQKPTTHSVGNGFPSPSLSPRAGSVWATQTLSSQQARVASSTWSTSGSWSPGYSGLRTPSGFEHMDFGADYFVQYGSTKRVPRSFEWEFWVPDSDNIGTPSLSPSPPDSPSSKKSPREQSHFEHYTLDQNPLVKEVAKRRMGPNEVSYYLGSRGVGPSDPYAGVNDMYLHISFKAPTSLMTQERITKIWSELRLRHTLLSSTVEFDGFEEIRFAYNPPTIYAEAYQAAKDNIAFKFEQSDQAILDEYLNGPRTLSDQKLASLWISTECSEADYSSLLSNTKEGQDESVQFSFWLLATHFLGDGMALHTTANEFFYLLGGGLEEAESANKGLEWDVKTGIVPIPRLSRLPPAQETRIETPESWGRLAWAASRVEFNRNQARNIGGQTFPRAKLGPRQTVVPTVSFSKEDTSAILKNCKAHGVTIAHAVFALANMAKIKISEEATDNEEWGSLGQKDKTMPMMLYSALNLRPNMIKGPEEESLGIKPDFFHLVIGYYNVMLPSFRISSLTPAQTFWHRARLTKDQTVTAVKSKWLTQRSKLMSLERERRAIGFEKEDERRRRVKASKDTGISLPAGLGIGKPPVAKPQLSVNETKNTSPSLAFLGVSMLGNLDGMYKHATFPKIQMQSLTTGSRQRPGAMLLFAYTFCGKLFFSLGYDTNAYPEGSVEKFWQAMLDYTKSLMVQGQQ